MEGLLELGRAVLAAQPFSVHLGAELARLEPGEAELVLPIAPHLGQQNGFVHGGAIGFLVDNAVTFAGGSVLGPSVLTREIEVRYLRPGRGERLVARASVIGGSERRAVARCDVFAVEGGSESICATGQGTVLSVEPQPLKGTPRRLGT